MKATPYVGITGFKTKEEILSVAPMFPKHGFDSESSHIPMLGFLVSYKRLADKTMPGKRSPVANDLGMLLSYVPARVLPMMHYYTINKPELAEEVKNLYSISNMYGSGLCCSLQINMDWPPIEQVKKILQEFPDMIIVLQLPPKTTQGLSLEQIAKRAKEYDSLVKYTLIDPSRGEGIGFDVKYSTELMLALNEVMPTTRIGIAGGLAADNVKEKILLILKDYNEDFCIDAQGRLRTENGKALDYEKARAYIKASAKALL